MTKIIACCNAKGGTGKTTVSLNLSACLAQSFHKRVLGIDLDAQGNFAVGLGIDPRKINKTCFQMLIADNPNPQDYIINVSTGFDLIPNTLESGMETRLSAKRNRERLLETRLRPIINKYDFIIIDTPPALETPTINALVAANEVLIIANCGYYALYGLDQLMDTLDSVQQDFDKQDLVIRALINYYDQRQNLDREMSEEIEKFFESLLLTTVIHKNVKLAESASAGKPIIDYNRQCSGYFDFMKLTKELLDIYERRRKVEAESLTSRYS